MGIERPDWNNDEGPVASGIPTEDDEAPVAASESDNKSSVERSDWGDGESRVPEVVPPLPRSGDDPDSALVDAGVMTQEEITALQTGKPKSDHSEHGVGWPGVDPLLLAEWDEEGGRDHHLAQAQESVYCFTEGLDETEAWEVIDSFDTLPTSIQTAVFRELALTPRRRGTEQDALDRLDAIEANLSPEDFEVAAAWLKKQSPEKKAAILMALGG